MAAARLEERTMPAAYGFESPDDGPPIFTMDDHDAVGSPDDSTSFTPSQPLRDLPLPNPSFSFPAKPDPSSTPTSSRRAGRRPLSAIEMPTKSYSLDADPPSQPVGRAALPAFSFNPGASLPPDPHTSALGSPTSQQSPRIMPSGHRPAGHGHRRGGSEFVGGRLREGNSIAVISGSPTKSEAGFASPKFVPPRKGHRRGVSSALSTNDLSLLPPHQPWTMKGSSAPNSPTNFDELHRLPILDQPLVQQPAEIETQPKPAKPEPMNVEVAESNTPVQLRPAAKARVGFSDTLEFIPRPLSLVSTDTSSTITARPGHTVSGSITSIVSTTSFTGNDSTPTISRSPTRDLEDPRPSTAGAILERTPSLVAAPGASPRRRNSIPALLDTAETVGTAISTPSPTKASKRWTFFGLEPFASPTKTRPLSAGSAELATRAVSASSSSDHGSDSATESTSKETKQSKKQGANKRRKKVKGWAGSILPRKQKSDGDKRGKYNVRPPTPPASTIPADEEDDDEHVDVPSPATQPTPILTVTESSTPPRPAPTQDRRSEEVSSPMIDLDAALGPFNTPLPHNPEWEAAQRAAGSAGKRRLHSAQGMRGFSGPGMHYHRRAESAPDLPPFDAGRSAISRFGSSSTMADVFEEDEEDEKDANGNTKKTEESEDSEGDSTPPAVTPSLPTPPVEAAPSISTSSLRRKSSGLSDKDQASTASIRLHSSRTSLHESVIAEEAQGVRFRVTNVFQSEPSGSPRLSPRSVSGPSHYPPLDFQTAYANGTGNMPLSPNSMSYASSHPSPRSPMSADTQRLSTAPSSVHEENSFQSLLRGEPGPEVRLSVDYDIPSLTSSNSTMTRDSTFVPHARMSQPTLREPRPLSVSSAAFGRRRSSLVSLSRLISSSHGERSKLSMEVTLDNEPEKKKSKNGKTKRLGKLMQFWKHKDTAPA